MFRWVAIFAMALFASVPAQAQKVEGLAQTPPMGWNSWNHYACDIDEKLIRDTADAMVSSGLRDAGYVYVNLDDCWQGERDADGWIQPDPKRFPSGMKALGDYLHERGLKFGIYSDAGEKTCQRFPGSQGYEFQDALQYARWGVDYVKYDWCFTGQGIFKRNPREAFTTMSRAIAASGRPMVFSICEWGGSKPWDWAQDVGHLWRTTGDIINCWDCTYSRGHAFSEGILPILEKQVRIQRFAGPGGWNDPDMLEVGHLPTLEENRSHFAIWAMLPAPLIMGTDVTHMKPEIRDILANPRLIAINQDPAGNAAFRWVGTDNYDIWARRVGKGDWVVAVLNRVGQTQDITVDWQAYPLRDRQIYAGLDSKTYALTDVWTGKPAGDTSRPLKLSVKPRDTHVFRLSLKK